MLVNKYCQVILGEGEQPPEDITGRRFTTVYTEIVERGLSFPTNDNKLPNQTRFKKILIWGAICGLIGACLYFL